jgi:hypothetical protein
MSYKKYGKDQCTDKNRNVVMRAKEKREKLS